MVTRAGHAVRPLARSLQTEGRLVFRWGRRAYIDLNGRGLEIGASHGPLLPKTSGRIQTVDHASKAELVEKYRAAGIDEDVLANTEDVDYIWTPESLADAVGERDAFDYIICSHVIEHVDLIGFLEDCEALLRDGRRLSLLIPDKRYCFDLLHPLTTVGTAVEAHLSGMGPQDSPCEHPARAPA
jgi:SAM-dependent methyltransferase